MSAFDRRYSGELGTKTGGRVEGFARRYAGSSTDCFLGVGAAEGEGEVEPGEDAERDMPVDRPEWLTAVASRESDRGSASCRGAGGGEAARDGAD